MKKEKETNFVYAIQYNYYHNVLEDTIIYKVYSNGTYEAFNSELNIWDTSQDDMSGPVGNTFKWVKEKNLCNGISFWNKEITREEAFLELL